MSSAATKETTSKAQTKSTKKASGLPLVDVKDKSKPKKAKASTSKAKSEKKSLSSTPNSSKAKGKDTVPAFEASDTAINDSIIVSSSSTQESKNDVSESVSTSSLELDARAKALASIKIGPKGVYTEDSIRVYLQEIGRIRLLRPDEEIELARKIADLLHLEELAAQFESDHDHYPTTKEWAALVEMPLIKFRRRLMLGRRAKEKMVQSNLRLFVSIAKNI